MLAIFWALLRALRDGLRSRARLAAENLALRQQLAAYQRQFPKPRLNRADRCFWVLLYRIWSGCKNVFVLAKPATLIGWHRKGLRFLWNRRCRFGGPRIPQEHIDFIRTISREHPELGAAQIALELETKLGVRHHPSTVRRYRWRPSPEPPNTPRQPSQKWRTFLKNEADGIWACDFVVELFDLAVPVYIFVVMELASRRIVWINATTSPSLDWVKAQLRQAAPFEAAPKFLIHDNDGIFGQFRKRVERRPFRCELDRWLHHAMGARGIPIPYGAPNANAHVERFNRTLREHCLDHFVFLNVRHLVRVLRRYVEFYNRARPSQATRKIPDPYPDLRAPPPTTGKLVALPVLGGLHHDYRRAG